MPGRSSTTQFSGGDPLPPSPPTSISGHTFSHRLRQVLSPRAAPPTWEQMIRKQTVSNDVGTDRALADASTAGRTVEGMAVSTHTTRRDATRPNAPPIPPQATQLYGGSPSVLRNAERASRSRASPRKTIWPLRSTTSVAGTSRCPRASARRKSSSTSCA